MAKQEHEYGREIYYGDGVCIMTAPEGSPRQLKMEASNRWQRTFPTNEGRKDIWKEAEKEIDKEMTPVKKPVKKKASRRKSKKKSS